MFNEYTLGYVALAPHFFSLSFAWATRSFLVFAINLIHHLVYLTCNAIISLSGPPFQQNSKETKPNRVKIAVSTLMNILWVLILIKCPSYEAKMRLCICKWTLSVAAAALMVDGFSSLNKLVKRCRKAVSAILSMLEQLLNDGAHRIECNVF